MNNINWNKVGVWASIACAIHCAITPLALVLAPLAGFAFFDHWVEMLMVGCSFVIASYSNLNSYFKFHKNYKPIIWMSGGFGLIAVAHIMHTHGPVEVILSIIGALIIAGSLIYNQKLSHSCEMHTA